MIQKSLVSACSCPSNLWLNMGGWQRWDALIDQSWRITIDGCSYMDHHFSSPMFKAFNMRGHCHDFGIALTALWMPGSFPSLWLSFLEWWVASPPHLRPLIDFDFATAQPGNGNIQKVHAAVLISALLPAGRISIRLIGDQIRNTWNLLIIDAYDYPYWVWPASQP